MSDIPPYFQELLERVEKLPPICEEEKIDPAHFSELLDEQDYEDYCRSLRLLELARSKDPLTQEELAELCGVSPSAISQLETTAKNKARNIITQEPHSSELTNYL